MGWVFSLEWLVESTYKEYHFLGIMVRPNSTHQLEYQLLLVELLELVAGQSLWSLVAMVVLILVAVPAATAATPSRGASHSATAAARGSARQIVAVVVVVVLLVVILILAHADGLQVAAAAPHAAVVHRGRDAEEGGRAVDGVHNRLQQAAALELVSGDFSVGGNRESKLRV